MCYHHTMKGEMVCCTIDVGNAPIIYSIMCCSGRVILLHFADTVSKKASDSADRITEPVGITKNESHKNGFYNKCWGQAMSLAPLL